MSKLLQPNWLTTRHTCKNNALGIFSGVTQGDRTSGCGNTNFLFSPNENKTFDKINKDGSGFSLAMIVV